MSANDELDALDSEDDVTTLPDGVVRRVGQLVMERDELAARLAAWEPVVRAAYMSIVWGASCHKQELADAIRALPEEHRP